jgi:hypothetical protein
MMLNIGFARIPGKIGNSLKLRQNLKPSGFLSIYLWVSSDTRYGERKNDRILRGRDD